MDIAVIGAGTWGTALSQVLALNGNSVSLWHYKEEFSDELQIKRKHPNLKTMLLSENITVTSKLTDLPNNAPLVIAIPTHSFKSVLPNLKFLNSNLLISASKGIDHETGLLMTQLICNLMDYDKDNIVAISGPSHAEEVFNKTPTAIVAASINVKSSNKVQNIFSNEFLRVYTSTDIVGVEVGGAVKNVIAISAGICEGLDLGDNTMAALLTRGLQEIIRLGVFFGAEKSTFSGLSGIGDLIVTAYSKHSRNRHVGYMLSQGLTIDEILLEMKMIAEGVNTTKSIYQIAKQNSLDMPICTETYNILFNGKNPKAAISELMQRKLINE